MQQRDAKLDDWSWRTTRRRLGVLHRLTRPYRGRTALSVVSLLTATITALAPPYLAKYALDDATASVDATTEAQIRTGLRTAMEGRTTLINAHRLSTIALADEIVVLDDGRIAARGTHDELRKSSAVYREIYEHGLLEAEFASRVEERGAA